MPSSSPSAAGGTCERHHVTRAIFYPAAKRLRPCYLHPAAERLAYCYLYPAAERLSYGYFYPAAKRLSYGGDCYLYPAAKRQCERYLYPAAKRLLPVGHEVASQPFPPPPQASNSPALWEREAIGGDGGKYLACSTTRPSRPMLCTMPRPDRPLVGAKLGVWP